MVKNLLIARKTCRPSEVVGMFIFFFLNYIFERPVSSGSCQDLNVKRGKVNGKK